MAAPFSHPLLPALTGSARLSRESNNVFIKVVAPSWVSCCVLMHATWNGSATFGGEYGFFAAFWNYGACSHYYAHGHVFSLRREGRIVRQFLYPDYQTACLIFRNTKSSADSGPDGNVLVRATKAGLVAWRRMRCKTKWPRTGFHSQSCGARVWCAIRTGAEREKMNTCTVAGVASTTGLRFRKDLAMSDPAKPLALGRAGYTGRCFCQSLNPQIYTCTFNYTHSSMPAGTLTRAQRLNLFSSLTIGKRLMARSGLPERRTAT